MAPIRRLLAQRYIAMALCAAALLLKLAVPTGYMIGNSGAGITIEVCSGIASAPTATTTPGMRGHASGHDMEHKGKAQTPCPFLGLSAAAVDAIDPIQLAALIAFVVEIGRLSTPRPPDLRQEHLRPPLRGPPLTS